MAVGIVEEREAAMAAAERGAAMAAAVVRAMAAAVRAMAAAARVAAAMVAAAAAAAAERVAAVPGKLRLCQRRRWGLLARSRLRLARQQHHRPASNEQNVSLPLGGDGNFRTSARTVFPLMVLDEIDTLPLLTRTPPPPFPLMVHDEMVTVPLPT